MSSSKSVRIYDLARDLSQTTEEEIKAADLAKELREMPEFKHLRDVIKSHSSSVPEEVADKIRDIYERKSGKTAQREAEAAEVAARRAEEDRDRLAAEERRRREEVNARRQLGVTKPRPSGGALAPPPMPPVHGAMGSRPPQGMAQRPPAPLPPPIARTGAPGAVAPPRPVPTGVAQLRSLSKMAPIPMPAPGKAGDPPPVPAPQAPAAAVTAPAAASSAVAAPAAAPAAAPRPSAPPVSSPSTQQAQQPVVAPRNFAPMTPPVQPATPRHAPGPQQGGRPASSDPRSHSGPGGDARRGDGRPPQQGPRPGGDDQRRAPQGGGQGPRPGGGSPRPGGGSGGFNSGTPGRPGGTVPPLRRDPVRAGQPPAPGMPSLRSDSPFIKRVAPPPPRPGESRPGGQGGPGGDYRRGPGSGPPSDRRPGGPGDNRTNDRNDRGGERTGRGPAGDRGPGAPLVIPQLEVMPVREGAAARRGKPGTGKKGAETPAKKKGLKTIIRDEIEVKPSKVYGLADEFRRPLGLKKGRPGPGGRGQGGRSGRPNPVARGPVAPAGPIRLGSTLTLVDFAERINVAPAEIIKKVFLMGKMLTINSLIDSDLCELIAQDLGIDIVIETEGDEQDVETFRPTEDATNLKPRPPVVTIMGHVDHGKTTLLDAYRRSAVVAGEFGGITQHIGAYHVDTPKGEVVFLDTPGHAAFTSMRARGAKVTDIVILVVSAEDGVMPQTVEAINHAREADVPIIVAINKIDLPSANPQRVRTELMQYSILPEELGGSNIFVEISAKKGINLDELLDMIILQSQVLELKADPDCRAEGAIIESHVDPLRGAVATVLVDKGTLKLGDIFVVGTQTGRVRAMIDDAGKNTKETGPSHPVEVIGLTGTPEVGELFVVVQEERIAREIAARRLSRRRLKDLGTTRHVSLEGLHDLVQEGKLKELKIILKGDVQGSIEAINQALVKLSNAEVRVRLLHTAAGSVTESDINLAHASDAIVIGFNVRPDPGAEALAAREGIEIRNYRIIYELIEDVQKAILGMLAKQYKQVTQGRIEIRQIFRMSKFGNIAGCMVLSGEVTRQNPVRLIRDSVVLYEGKLGSLRRVKEDVNKVAAGYECGLTIENYQDIRQGDIVESFKIEELAPQALPPTTA